MSEENKQPTDAELAAQSKEELIAALQGEFATGATKVYVNSVGREYAFREISVKEQKTLTRIVSGNERRKDVAYDAQCALINQAALDKSFDVYELTDFDRVKILLALYQENMFQNEVEFTCRECGARNKYRVDFEKTLARLDECSLEPVTHVYENSRFKYTFELEYPSVKLVSAFHKSYFARQGGVPPPRREAKADDAISNLEYIDLFIKKVTVENKQTGAKREVSLRNYRVQDVEDILQAFPQDALYSENGAVRYVAKQYLKPLNEAFDKHKCASCGEVHNKEGADNPGSFF